MSTPTRLWTRLNIVLLAALVIVLVFLVAVLGFGASALPWTTSAERSDSAIKAVKDTASAEVVALFGADYTKLDAWQKKVLAGATGAFRDELDAELENTKAKVFSGKIVSTVNILDAGVNAISGSNATVFIAADLTERGTASAGAPAAGNCPAGAVCHQVLMKVVLDKAGSGWKVSNLGYAQ